MFAYVVGAEGGDLTRDFRDDAWGMPKSVVIDNAFDWKDDKSPAPSVERIGHLRSAREGIHPPVPRATGRIARHLCRDG